MRASLIGGGALLCLQGPVPDADASARDRIQFTMAPIVIMIGADQHFEDGGVAPVAVDFSLLTTASGTAGNDLIADDGVTVNFAGGVYNPSNGGAGGYVFDILDPVSGGTFNSEPAHQVLDERDSYTAFELDGSTDIEVDTNNRVSRFLVVSNTAFDIYAEASDLTATGDFAGMGYDNIGYQLRLNRTGGSGVWTWGTEAQNPSNGGMGIIGGINDLGDMAGGPVKVFDGGRKTAAQRGALLGQAVAFQSRYRLRRSGGLAGALNNYDLSMGTGELSATVTYTAYTP